MALGAAPAAVTWMVLRRTIAVVAAGTLAGSALSLWMARLIEALLYGVQPRDVSTFVAAASILALVGLVSAWLPARHAARIDPAVVLKEI